MLANLVVDLVTIYGDLMGISATFLAVTFMAIGNCIGDAVASYSIAKKGYGGMAMTGCFACPLFNFLIGLSLSSARILWEDEGPIFSRSIEFNLFNEKATVI
jgi:Ca2+/Na+ antiporter